MYDVFFLSYDEPHADAQWAALEAVHAPARRVEGVRGIQAAHARCARLSRTPHFFVVDADNEITRPEVFRFSIPEWDRSYVHLWYAENPVNGLVYGWGGIKLFPRSAFHETPDRIDMTTSFPLKIVPEIASITRFNVSPFETWRSAFRECVKLALNPSEEAHERLRVWCSTARGDHAEECLTGALMGAQYAKEKEGDIAALLRINDYAWLAERFRDRCRPPPSSLPASAPIAAGPPV